MSSLARRINRMVESALSERREVSTGQINELLAQIGELAKEVSASASADQWEKWEGLHARYQEAIRHFGKIVGGMDRERARLVGDMLDWIEKTLDLLGEVSRIDYELYDQSKAYQSIRRAWSRAL